MNRCNCYDHDDDTNRTHKCTAAAVAFLVSPPDEKEDEVSVCASHEERMRAAGWRTPEEWTRIAAEVA